MAAGEFGRSEVFMRDAKLVDLTFIQGIAQAKHAEENAIPYFEYVDGVVREVKAIVFPDPD